MTKLRWMFPGGANGQDQFCNGIYGLKNIDVKNDDLV